MNKVLVRTLTGLSITAVVAGVLWLNHVVGEGRVPLYVGSLLGILAVLELGRMFSDRAAIVVGAGALLFARARLEPLTDAGPLDVLREFGLVLAFAAGVALLAQVLGRFLGGGRLALWQRPSLATWIAFPLLGLVPLEAAFGTRGLVALLLVSKIGDVAGYFFGRSFGRSHPFPRISPNKTTAGCVASLVAGSAMGAVVVLVGLVEGSPLAGLLAGAVTNVAAQAGDLFESVVKRRAEVKDSSGLLGASGGVLDVVDSLLFTVPLALVAWPLWFQAA